MEAVANLAAASATDRDTLADLTNAVSNLTNQLAEKDKLITSLKLQLNDCRGTTNARGTKTPLDPQGHCWTHGHKVSHAHNSSTCRNKAPGHQDQATRANTMGGSTKGKYE